MISILLYIYFIFFADLSKNKLTELPQECTDYYSLERLVLYHNFIRSIPDSVIYLQSLQFLDLSRNSLSYLPPTICELPLQGLIVNNNKLVSLPEEIGKMSTLMQLDASCNEITHLPVQIGDLASLKTLNLRRNHLQEIPIGIKMPIIFFKNEGARDHSSKIRRLVLNEMLPTKRFKICYILCL